jgi:hypothetical protein
MERFQDDDEGYRRWLANHPNGFVINCERSPRPSYLMLHRATCRDISTSARTNYTTTGYIKLCALEKRDLEDWAAREVGGQLRPCRHCSP